MQTKTFVQVSLTRPELEQAIRNFCALKDGVKLDGFWVKSEHLAAPQTVCGFTYCASEATPND
jgi:hypothetical protein